MHIIDSDSTISDVGSGVDGGGGGDDGGSGGGRFVTDQRPLTTDSDDVISGKHCSIQIAIPCIHGDGNP